MNLTPPHNSNPSLVQLLHRKDIWRGHSQRFSLQKAVDTGYDQLNTHLANKGWPLGSLIEICQQGQSEWRLLAPALVTLSSGLIILLNPPLVPFGQSFIKLGIDLERILIVDASAKADFLASFAELASSEACAAILAWEPQQQLSYTELRKCLLATAESEGLRVIFRRAGVQQQSSPAVLRVLTQVVANELQATIFKQRGLLQKQQPRPISLSLPETWKGFLPYHLLDQSLLPNPASTQQGKAAKVLPLRRGGKG